MLKTDAGVSTLHTESNTGAAENDCAHKKLHTQPQGITSEAEEFSCHCQDNRTC